MRSFFERFLEGEHEAVWSELMLIGDRVREEPLYADALRVARETMRRARLNIETLIARLERAGYQFGYANLSLRSDFAATQPQIFRPPQPDIHDVLTELESMAGSLPLSLYAWYEYVGEVNFVGKAPESWRPDGFKSEVYKRFVGPLPDGVSENVYHFYEEHPELLQASDVWLDPLQVISVDAQFALFDVWKSEQMDDLDDTEDAQDREENAESFAVEIAPDANLKFDTGGLGAYELVVPNEGIDGLLMNEWHHTTFVDYLRMCFRWAGFPGFEMYRNPPKELAGLTEGLLLF